MKPIIKLSILFPTLFLALTGCKSTPENKKVNFNTTFAWEFTQPERDNRFPSDTSKIYKHSQSMVLTSDEENKSSYININPIHIVRCDEPVTICRHGITNPTIKYSIKKYGVESNQFLISGVYTFELKKDVSRDSRITSVKKSTLEGFPMLPQESHSFPFSGVSGNGEVISVSGPYGTTFKVALKVNDETVLP